MMEEQNDFFDTDFERTAYTVAVEYVNGVVEQCGPLDEHMQYIIQYSYAAGFMRGRLYNDNCAAMNCMDMACENMKARAVQEQQRHTDG